MAQLPSTASIKDIIAALQAMEAINQKADLVSVVGSPALSTDDVATIISKLQTAKNTLAANITTQGTSATGTESLSALAAKVTVGSSVRRWASGTGTTDSGAILNVSGLAFKPSVIILKMKAGTNNYRKIFHDASSGNFDASTGGTWPIEVAWESWYDPGNGYNPAMNWYGTLSNNDKFTITSNSFSTHCPVASASVSWFAYE
ncbi:hypothetical protein ACTID9_01115 [Brevibacillus fluminis]|uniref:hypothetical protein n=1 Tax=Brevibacillus fluminis TaxID=511487 RepID=UPI003F88D057